MFAAQGGPKRRVDAERELGSRIVDEKQSTTVLTQPDEREVNHRCHLLPAVIRVVGVGRAYASRAPTQA